MTRHILLDSSPLSALCLPAKNPGLVAIAQWSRSCMAAGHHLYVPEVIDYELRRELLRAGKTTSITRLDGLKTAFHYLPITTTAMLRAADLWAHSRLSGVPTGDPKKLDIDVILAAQALTLVVPSTENHRGDFQRQPPLTLCPRRSLDQYHPVTFTTALTA